MYAGGSGEFSITHVKFIVDPVSMYRSGAPIISVDGSGFIQIHIYSICTTESEPGIKIKSVSAANDHGNETANEPNRKRNIADNI